LAASSVCLSSHKAARNNIVTTRNQYVAPTQSRHRAGILDLASGHPGRPTRDDVAESLLPASPESCSLPELPVEHVAGDNGLNTGLVSSCKCRVRSRPFAQSSASSRGTTIEAFKTRLVQRLGGSPCSLPRDPLWGASFLKNDLDYAQLGPLFLVLLSTYKIPSRLFGAAPSSSELWLGSPLEQPTSTRS